MNGDNKPQSGSLSLLSYLITELKEFWESEGIKNKTAVGSHKLKHIEEVIAQLPHKSKREFLKSESSQQLKQVIREIRKLQRANRCCSACTEKKNEENITPNRLQSHRSK
jgi:hypothetical protein